jgi:hypothetical protein
MKMKGEDRRENEHHYPVFHTLYPLSLPLSAFP